jgi:hypothetical protein
MVVAVRAIPSGVRILTLAAGVKTPSASHRDRYRSALGPTYSHEELSASEDGRNYGIS